MRISSQKQAIYRELAKGRRLSPIDVQKLCGSMKASTRIGEIEREQRIEIQSEFVRTRNGARHKVYWIDRACR